MTQPVMINGFALFPSLLDIAAQRGLVRDIRAVVQAAPLIQPVTPSGRQMSVRMTSAGDVGWVTDTRGYRYQPCHPNGQPWPAIPASVLAVWRAVSGVERDPDSCLINFYAGSAKMGMHQDKDEGDMAWPVVSISLGDEALFRMGNVERGGKTASHWLKSGDVVVMGGAARLAHHGVDRIKPGTSTLLSKGGRINLTMRIAG